MNYLDDIIHDPLVHVEIGDAAARGEDRLWSRDVPNRNRVAARHPAENLLLLLTRRISDMQLEHEPIDLRFGERICSFLLDRILRRENEERLIEPIGRSSDGHLLLLHRLKKRRLHFCWSAVDLVCENDVREDRAFLDAELSVGLIVDLSSENVGRQQIRCELNSLKRRADRFGKCPDRKST